MIEDEFAGLAPINFFQCFFDCPHLEGSAIPDIDKKGGARFLLPDTSMLCGEDAFAKVGIAWNEEGIHLLVKVDQPVKRVAYPELIQGDSAEFFFDTRDVKTSGYNTRFCHHFYFLPEAVAGHHAGEITHFRTEESHQHCDPELLKVKTKTHKNRYEMQVFIPGECLYGYDPGQFDRMGFSYRINRPDGPSQHFSALTEEYRIEQQPSLWSSLRLVR